MEELSLEEVIESYMNGNITVSIKELAKRVKEEINAYTLLASLKDFAPAHSTDILCKVINKLND